MLSVNVKYLQGNFLKSRLKKSMLKNVLTVHTIFKIFLQNYSLSITNDIDLLEKGCGVGGGGYVNRQGSPIHWGGWGYGGDWWGW